jgi:peptidoglycan/xylan/chitin deacetylase (PgdA/CDA1 family)
MRCLRHILFGIAAVFAVASTWPLAAAEKRIALSFDDVPRQRGAFLDPDDRTKKLIAALKAAGVGQAAFFINPGRLDSDDGKGGAARIDDYVKAGHVIANHGWSHLRLSDTATDAFIADIDRADAWLRQRAGYRPWFRYPYLDEGGHDVAKRNAVRRSLSERRLSNGYVTADGSDWHLEGLAIDAVRAGKALDMDALRKLYVASQMSGVAYHDELARRALGRAPAHMLLLHETDLAALFLGDLVAELKRHGWTIVSADVAYADPIGRAVPDVPYASGTVTGMIARARGVTPPYWPFWMSTEAMTDLFDRQVVKPAIDEASRP